MESDASSLVHFAEDLEESENLGTHKAFEWAKPFDGAQFSFAAQTSVDQFLQDTKKNCCPTFSRSKCFNWTKQLDGITFDLSHLVTQGNAEGTMATSATTSAIIDWGTTDYQELFEAFGLSPSFYTGGSYGTDCCDAKGNKGGATKC
jgi:hypothetical protein